MITEYTALNHAHNIAAWAGVRAASVARNRLKVGAIRPAIDAAAFALPIVTAQDLPVPELMDETHRIWRDDLISRADSLGIKLSHGQAAKIINIYHKIRFHCFGPQSDPRINAIHPPVDRLLLQALRDANFGGFSKEWGIFEKKAWSTYDADTYDDVIWHMRAACAGEPLWKIEAYWIGYQ